MAVRQISARQAPAYTRLEEGGVEMRKMLAAVLTAAVVLGASAVASAAPATVNGSFVEQFMRAKQPHRLYFAVRAGRGAKTCEVTLAGKTVEVSLGTDKRSPVMHIFYVHPKMAKRALSQSANASSPSRRVVCSH
jgi:hypothetical protein